MNNVHEVVMQLLPLVGFEPIYTTLNFVASTISGMV